MTTKEKIDQALGISCGKSMDDMLNELDLDSKQVTETLDELDNAAGKAFDQIDQAATTLQKGIGPSELAISDMTTSLREVEDMIGQTKLVFKHIVENITSSDLIDSELVHSAAALVESMHLNIAEFISIYKQKSKFVEKIKLMIFQQQQRIELAELKHRQNLELIEAKKKEPETVDAQAGGMEFDTDAVVKSMQRAGGFDFAQAQDAEFEDMNPPEDDDEEDEEDENAVKKKKR